MTSDGLSPTPALLLISTLPRSLSMFLLTTSMPTPRPDMLETCSAVEKPGSKIRRLAQFQSLLGEALDHFRSDPQPHLLRGGPRGRLLHWLDTNNIPWRKGILRGIFGKELIAWKSRKDAVPLSE